MHRQSPQRPQKLSDRTTAHWLARAVVSLAIWHGSASGAGVPATVSFRNDVQPILREFCFDCHGDGAKKGGLAFDELTSDATLLDHDLWLKVLKNVRAGLMPPPRKPHPSAGEQQRLEQWIKRDAFGIDPKNPDPGRVTVRRLNRVEYRNTVHDLMGIDFNSEVEFPPDDTGYGFDNIGDVLTVSPMLLEKYLAAAKAIVAEAVPTVDRAVAEQIVSGNRFQRTDVAPVRDGGRVVPLSYYAPGTVSTTLDVDRAGGYKLVLELGVRGGFDYDPGRCRVTFKLGDRELLAKEFGWYDNKTFRFEFDEKWEPGRQSMTVALEPLVPVDRKLFNLEMRVVQVTVLGPLEREHWTHPKNYDRFFTREVPAGRAGRRAYAREVLGRFATKAFRRPVDDPTVGRLAGLAEGVYTQPGKTFEAGIAHAMVAVLASPRFLFRLEEPAGAGASTANADIDEYSLASRLSYFLWSTLPDDGLLALAGRGELRRNLSAQVTRMLADPRSDNLIRNFTGQWLQTRDVEGISIDARTVLARDDGQERQMREQLAAFRAQFGKGTNRPAATTPPAAGPTNNVAQANSAGPTNPAGQTNAPGQRPGPPLRRFGPPRVELDRDLRDAMRRETEMFVGSIVHEDRPVTELIESDYTFLNEKLAKLYGMTNVIGVEMRRVTLPADSPRGGVLTDGSSLVVTSNPDRTSPVKRGLFILENVLGTPAPPPPPNIPALEASEKDFKDHEPTLREALQVHREKPLCASCHDRMDPLGLAFENFNALGMWREKERNQSIDAAGRLATGESFGSVRELKHILVQGHRTEFHRCLTEKLLTYALGRGLEYHDVEAVDGIVERLGREDGRFSALLMGVIESTPFQRMRRQATPTASGSGGIPMIHAAANQVPGKSKQP